MPDVSVAASLETRLRGTTAVSIFISWLGRLGSVDYGYVLSAAVDIAVVAFIIYKLMMFLKGTRAWQIMWGLGIFTLIYGASILLHLRALKWLLDLLVPLVPVALVILFYPELRQILEEIGRWKSLGRGFATLATEDLTRMTDELTKSVAAMSAMNVGALVVIEREVGLDNIIPNGHRMDSLVSSDLLRTIFHPGSPLHDGAVIIRGNRIVAASCTLPLSDSPRLGTVIHTRHKAALGVSEQSDAVVLVVSEETGIVSLSTSGELYRGLAPEQVRARLVDLLGAESRASEGMSQIRRTMSSALSRMRVGSSAERKH